MDLFPQSNDTIVFITEGSSFAPLISLKSEATVKWIFSDKSESTVLNPIKDFTSEGKRRQKLVVNPWSAVKMINIGYDAGDGGSWNIPFVADQHISKVENLDLVKDNLEIWCSSYNQMDTLIFDDFILLDTIECFLSQSVRHVSLKNTPSLTRLCLEDNDLTTLDISECPGLKDLRGAVNNYTTINFSEEKDDIWHICIRNNPQITNDTMFSKISDFPGLTELFIWETNQSGKFEAHSCFNNNNILILADGNRYTSLDLSGGILKGEGQSIISFNNNQLRSVNLEGFDEAYYVELAYNGMEPDTVDKILIQLDQLGTSGLPDKRISLRGNGIPTAAGLAAKERLEGRGWTVTVASPDINITGNDSIIRNGDLTPRIEDFTDFGVVKVGDTISHRFFVTNPGGYQLHLTGEPRVKISGADSLQFTVTSMPESLINWWGGFDTIEISFCPDETGIKNARIVIENDCTDGNNPFTFAIRGEGLPSVNDTIVSSGEIVCFGTKAVLIVAGESEEVSFMDNSTVNLIATQKIKLLPGFHAYNGSNMHAWITTTGESCNDLKSVSFDYSQNSEIILVSEKNKSCIDKEVVIYPNPGNGLFNMRLNNFNDELKLSVYNILGEEVHREKLSGQMSFLIDLSNLGEGIYVLKVQDNKTFVTKKIEIK